MTIRETCTCGAVMEFTSDRNIAGLDCDTAASKFRRAHKVCRVNRAQVESIQTLPPVVVRTPNPARTSKPEALKTEEKNNG